MGRGGQDGAGLSGIGPRSSVAPDWAFEPEDDWLHPDLSPDDIEDLAAIAEDLFPEAELEQEIEHNWCGEVSKYATRHLLVAGVDCFKRIGGFGPEGRYHCWVELHDGTIVDPTVLQFSDPRFGDDADSEFADFPGSDSVAVVPPGHPFARQYGERAPVTPQN